MQVMPSEPRDVAGARFDSSRALKLLEEMGTTVTRDLVTQMPNLLSFLKHADPAVVRQSISSGTILFAAVLDEMAFQFDNSGAINDWLEEVWSWMVQFKAVAIGVLQESSSVAAKVLLVKFLETCVLQLSSQLSGDQACSAEGKGWNFSFARIARGHPTLDPAAMEAESRNIVALLLNILQSAYKLHGSFVVTVINCLAAIAKNRPCHFDTILQALLGVDPSIATMMENHTPSIHYALRNTYVGFLRCSHPVIIESKDRLLSALRSLSPGEATEQIIRQVEKMSRNAERSRDTRGSKDDPQNGEAYIDLTRKRSSNALASSDNSVKRVRHDISATSDVPRPMNCDLQNDDDDDDDDDDDISITQSYGSSPASKMIEVIGAFLTQGEDGARSLELIISNMHADLLADIVIETMKRLPRAPVSCSNHTSALPANVNTPAVHPESPLLVTSSSLSSHLLITTTHSSDSSGNSMLHSDTHVSSNTGADPRRVDPRRLDPRKMAPLPTISGQVNMEITTNVHSGFDHESCGIDAIPMSDVNVEDEPEHSLTTSVISEPKHPSGMLHSELETSAKEEAILDSVTASCVELSSPSQANLVLKNSVSLGMSDGTDASYLDNEELSAQNVETLSEDSNYKCSDFTSHPELNDDEKLSLFKSVIERILGDYEWDTVKERLPLLARLVAQCSEDDTILETVKKYIIFDYHRDQGHELAMHVLYHLWTILASESKEHSGEPILNHYDNLLTLIAKSLIDTLPASDKSFNKLLVEAPHLPSSIFRLLEELCSAPNNVLNSKESDGDRVNQGLGTIWNLILVHPPSRQICLDIALKCAIHSSNEIRSRAIRLVANKLYLLPYASERIEQFATEMLLSVAAQKVLDSEVDDALSRKLRAESGCLDTSVSSSHSDPGALESEFVKPALLKNLVSFQQAQQHTSLFFALCSKKPRLIWHVFGVYGGAPKTVKQSIHRHMPNFVRNLGRSLPELLEIINEFPEGSENLVNQALQILTEESTPSADLIGAIKHLYDTRLKDVTILIPLLSSLSKAEVLPIFPRLVDLPLVKFQEALARILQGSAHTGPALTPTEVLIAIHDMDPAKDKVEQKKIIDVCNACFEQRTVFTQQVLAGSLNHLVDKVPIPFLLMRTVIKALDVYPALGDFVMEILSRLVKKQIWKAPKLWVGFLKCAYQTKPKSYHVFLELPSQQLENVLNKHPDLREPLASLVVQQNLLNTLPRPSLKVLGLIVEQQDVSMQYVSASPYGATLT